MAAKRCQWDLQSERSPPGEYCFWKLSPAGAIHAVTTPEALFPDAWSKEPLRQTSKSEKYLGRLQLVPSPDVIKSVHEGGFRQTLAQQFIARENKERKRTPVSTFDGLLDVRSNAADFPVRDGAGTTPGVLNRKIFCNKIPSAVADGMIQALGWGWGGQFRLGAGRERQELIPRCLLPEFKVRNGAVSSDLASYSIVVRLPSVSMIR